MWCRKLTENKTVVGGEKKGRERKRERQRRDLYLKARPQVPEHTGSLVTDWVEGDSDRCSVDSAGWAQDGVLDYLWCYCVFLSCLHRPAYDYQRYNGSMWQCGADRHHTHTWSLRFIPVQFWFSLPASSLCFLARVASHLYYWLLQSAKKCAHTRGNMFSFECLRAFLLSIHVERSLNYVYNSIIYEGYAQVVVSSLFKPFIKTSYQNYHH